jgi:DNA-binding MarR family transcriptional regulator
LRYASRVPVEFDTSKLASDLRVVAGQFMRRLRVEHRFSLMQGAVLGRLDREGPLSTADLAAAERVRQQSMAQTVSELEAQRLVNRSPDPSDRRRAMLELTDEGRRILAEDRRRREGWLAQAIEEELSVDEQDTLNEAVRLLARLTEL